jgi:hypothetical protein
LLAPSYRCLISNWVASTITPNAIAQDAPGTAPTG